MDEVEALKRKVKLMESVFANLDTKTVSEELNRVAKIKVRVLNLIDLLNSVSETKIDNTIYQEYIKYAKHIKGKIYEERKKQAIANSSSNVCDCGTISIDDLFYKIIDGKNVEITNFPGKYRNRNKCIKIPDNINGLPVTSIGHEAFAFPSVIARNIWDEYAIDCLKLSNSLKIIKNNAFYNALIKMIRIPSSVEYIDFQSLFTTNDVHILFEHDETNDKLPEFENAFSPNATLYTKNGKLFDKLKEYKERNRKYWDVSNDVDEFELEWSIYDKFEKIAQI